MRMEERGCSSVAAGFSAAKKLDELRVERNRLIRGGGAKLGKCAYCGAKAYVLQNAAGVEFLCERGGRIHNAVCPKLNRFSARH